MIISEFDLSIAGNGKCFIIKSVFLLNWIFLLGFSSLETALCDLKSTTFELLSVNKEGEISVEAKLPWLTLVNCTCGLASSLNPASKTERWFISAFE